MLRRKIYLSKFLFLPLLFSLSGCVYLVVGGVGALGGYVASPDTVEGITDRDAEDVWDAAHRIVSIMGTISEDRRDGGVIVARISGAKVTIVISRLNESSIKLSVKARKLFLPKIGIAQDVFVKIMSEFTE